MAFPLGSKLDCGNGRKIINLAPAEAAGEPVVYEQLQTAIENIAWKDDVRVRAAVNITVSAPGAAIDGVTMALNDRLLLSAQTAATENGIYIWNGAGVPMTRAPDANTFDELEAAITSVTEGSSANSSWRQTQVNGVLGTNNIVWTSFGASSSAASETTSGVAEIATQAETNTGTDDQRFVTPAKLKNASFMVRKFSANAGDGAATSIPVNHNLNTLDVQVYVYETNGSKREILVEKQHTSVNQVTLIFDTAPALNAVRVVVIG